MKLAGARVLITGGAGGIGRALAKELLEAGASVLLVGRSATALADAARALGGDGTRVGTLVADLTSATDRSRLVAYASTWNGGVDVLVNNAGVSLFGLYSDAAPESIEQTLAINLLAPMLLVRALLPTLAKQPQAAIVNVGSVFGAIGYPGNAAYSAAKFGLRGFSEALRRELANSTVRVLHVAPRATRTAINSRAVEALNLELGVATDAPETVAAWIRERVDLELADSTLGWPERLFVKLNALVPRLVDGALHKQLPAIQRYAVAGTRADDHPAQPAVNMSGTPAPIGDSR
jgi:short-subunit dehydrogenase